MILIKRRINFYLSRKSGWDDCPLRCQISWDSSRQRVTFNVGYRISPDKWDKEVQKCIPKTFHSKKKIPAGAINKEIERFSTVINSVFDKYERDEVIPEKEKIQMDLTIALGQRASKKVAKKTAPSQVSSLIDMFSIEMGTRNAWSKNTYKAITIMQNHLQDFQSES